MKIVGVMATESTSADPLIWRNSWFRKALQTVW